MPDRNGQPQLIAPSASPEEAAAIVAALERFRRATARAAPAGERARTMAARGYRSRACRRQAQADARDPWINT